MQYWIFLFALCCAIAIVFSWPLEDDERNIKSDTSSISEQIEDYHASFKRGKKGKKSKKGKEESPGKKKGAAASPKEKGKKKGHEKHEKKDKGKKKKKNDHDAEELREMMVMPHDHCVFPFSYDGQVFHECTEYESSGYPWCSDDLEYKDKWHYCEVMTSDKWIKEYEKQKEKHGNDFFLTETDDKKKYYPKHLKDKLEAGQAILPYEEDEFENTFGRYKERNGTSIIDIIASVNKANDVTVVEEGDLSPLAPTFDYVQLGKTLLKKNRVRVVADKDCVFPFKYKGVVYHKCTSVDSDSLWCAKKYDAKKKGEKKCDVSMVGERPEGTPKECFFPFFYKNIKYDDCTMVESKYPWCSTTHIYHKGWKECEGVKREIVDEAENKLLVSNGWNNRKRDARRDRVYLWLDRIVPYKIDAALLPSADVIRGALARISEKTCIKFRELSGAETANNWIVFVKKTGCWSSVGRTFWTSGHQEISLGTNCNIKGIIIHEVLHALGFWHEQSRPDRDRYVEIFWENIVANELHNFNKYGHGVMDTLTSPYDKGSIMHYGKYSFAKDAEKPTILSRNGASENLGQRNDLSQTDIDQVNYLYDCQNTGTGWSNWSDFGPCDDSCKKERTRFCMDPNDRTTCANPLTQDYIFWGVDAEKVTCPNVECYAPVNGHWNKWQSWGECSVTCDFGIQTRVRECTDPAPKHGGSNCVDSNTQQQACQKRSCSSGPYDCSFDVDTDPMCSWQNLLTDDFDWKRHSGPTPSSSTGPSGDRTSGSGYYLFIETSSPAQNGWRAKIISNIMSGGQTRCMEFAWNMYGISTGSLNVYVKNTVTGVLTNVFTKSGDQLQNWHTSKFDIYAPNHYKVIIEGIRGSSFQGDIGIDDISIKDNSCFTTPIPPPPYVPSVVPVGCYHSLGYIGGKRIFSELKNMREHIDWKNLTMTGQEIVKMCSAVARDQNYEYFGIEYWGECWTGPTDVIQYGRDGEAEDCWPMKSLDKGPFIIGKSFTAMVYKWV